MRIFRSLENLPKFVNPVVTVGSFDGVHLGHQQILEYVKAGAKRYEGESIVITFNPHPQQVLHPEQDFFLINTLEENIELIAAEEIDNLIIIPFTIGFSQLSFTQFLDFLTEKIGVKALVMGPNHNVGHNREGNCKTMQGICVKKGIEIILIPEFILSDNKVRSSKIREYIVNKDITKAEALLGHPWKKK